VGGNFHKLSHKLWCEGIQQSITQNFAASKRQQFATMQNVTNFQQVYSTTHIPENQ
jgi:hypothetical protein